MKSEQEMEPRPKSRRAALRSLAVGAAAVPTLAAASRASAVLGSSAFKAPEDCLKPGDPLSERLQNIVVRTHLGAKALFYEDLLRDRIVSINFMSIHNDAIYPVTGNLAGVQDLLGERLGREIFMYSISVDPENDTPERLAEFAHRFGARRGWEFLTPRPDDVGRLKSIFFAHPPGIHHAEDCSMGLCRYGNTALGLWASYPAKDRPENIVGRFDWVTPKTPAPATSPVRRGPAILPSERRES